MANFTLAAINVTTDNYVSRSVADTHARHPLYKTLFVVQVTVTSAISVVMFVSNSLILYAVWITPRLRVKAYALPISLAVTNLLFSIVLCNWVIHEVVGETPCGLAAYNAAVRPLERWILYSSFVHISFIAVDRYMTVMNPLNNENRMTPTVIRNLIVSIWLTAGVLSLPCYFGFIWPEQGVCIVTFWPMFETTVQLCLYGVSCVLVVGVYTRIWRTVMHIELRQQQQLQ